MELTILGCHSPYPPQNGAMNGYLVRYGSTVLLVDAGSGVASRLSSQIGIENLTAVVISHLHEDHISDLHCLRFMQNAAQLFGRTEKKLQVYLPPEPAPQRAWVEGGEAWQDLYSYDPAARLVLGELEIRFTRTNHPVPTYAMRIAPAQEPGPVLFYTADTGQSEEVLNAARGADLLLVEASLTEEWAAKRIFGHLTAAEAATMARDAGAKRCVLTHLWPGVDSQKLLEEGRAVHPNIELAKEGKAYRIG